MVSRSSFGAALAVLLLLTGCRSPDPGTVEATMDVGGRTRSYLLHEPAKTPTAGPHPLVLVLHGRAGDAVSAEDMTRFSAVADREGFAVAYPDGVDRSWNDARGEGPAADQGVDDVAFLSDLVDTLVRDRNVDPKRVYATGLSNGGLMTFRLACELSDKLAAFAPVIATLPEKQACAPSRPLPIAIFVGTEDPLVPYGGGEVASNRGRVLSADATRARFAELGGCEPVDVDVTRDDHDDDTSLHETSHSKCRDGAEVRLYSFVGAGHTWPDGDQYLPKAIIGRVSHEMNATEEIWRFFQRHTR